MKKYSLLLLPVLLSIVGCRKDINIPTDELENIFDTWTMYQYSGGEGGGTFTPEGTLTIAFKKNGICKEYENGKQQTKYTFTFSENPTQYGNRMIYTINYEKPKLTFSNKYLKSEQTVMFSGKDTLILMDPCCDQYMYCYVRNK